jgi:hypothetical protein
MKLKSATVCLDCEEIFQAGRNFDEQCPVCFSRSLVQLNCWLSENRTQITQITADKNSIHC